MAEATLESARCKSCGAGVRENTQFCYNCGKKYADSAGEINGLESAAISNETQTALDDLATKLKGEDSESGDKLAIAAARRKIARVVPKKAVQAAWEPDDNHSALFIFAVSLTIFFLVIAVVFVTVYWK